MLGLEDNYYGKLKKYEILYVCNQNRFCENLVDTIAVYFCSSSSLRNCLLFLSQIPPSLSATNTYIKKFGYFAVHNFFKSLYIFPYTNAHEKYI